MRKLRVFEHISLDGVIQSSSENHFPYTDWTAPYRTSQGGTLVLDTQGEKFDLLLGRTTYDMWSTYWPKAPSFPMSDRLNGATKYVVTHRPESLEWGPFQALSSNLVDDVRALKETNGPDLVLWGSSTLTSVLLEHNLVDELVLIVYPVLIGTGKKFFAENTPARKFALDNTKTSPTGILVNTYKFLGTL